MKRIFAILLINWIALGLTLGNVKLPGLFSDNMVFQCEMRVPVWGWADPGEIVIAELGGHIGETISGWEMEIISWSVRYRWTISINNKRRKYNYYPGCPCRRGLGLFRPVEYGHGGAGKHECKTGNQYG